MPSDLDPGICNDVQSGVAIGHSFLHQGMRSHILLAACGAKERAYEAQGKGVFTTALLKLLYEDDAQTLTYANLLRDFPHLTE
jgi:hypothetical protein